MAIYHLSIKIIKRGDGKSAVAAAAYRSASAIKNERNGITSDYTGKRGVEYTEVMLPAHAPTEFQDRKILWNSVEMIEKHKKAQLAREIEIALPNELSREEQIALAKRFCQKAFVDEGMCADVCIHNPPSENENVHAHIMLTMRPFNEDGSWGDKQKKEYILDKDGKKIYDKKKRQYKCNSIPATDWSQQTKAEEWRTLWEVMTNMALEQNQIDKKVDRRSYKRRGVEQIPTIHMGVEASQMEQKGIPTERGERNREITADNRMIQIMRSSITELENMVKKLVAKLKRLRKKNIEAPDHLSHQSKQYLSQDELFKEAEEKKKQAQKEYETVNKRIKELESRKLYVTDLLKYLKDYKDNRPIFEESLKVWRKEKYQSEHYSELSIYETAEHWLKRHNRGKIPNEQRRKTELVKIEAELHNLQGEKEEKKQGYLDSMKAMLTLEEQIKKTATSEKTQITI